MKSKLLIILSCLCLPSLASYASMCSSLPNNTCACTPLINYEIQLSCPSTDNQESIITYNTNLASNATIDMECPTNVTIEGFQPRYSYITDYDYLSPLLSKSIEVFKISYCPMLLSVNDMLRRMGVKNVKKICMQNNSDVKLEANYFTNSPETLEELDVADSNVKYIDPSVFDGMINLRDLNLSKNLIRVVNDQFSHLTNLRSLLLWKNSISSLPIRAFKNLENLVDLHLWSNSLTQLEVGLFAPLKNLRSLELSMNLLTELPDDIFHNLAHLEKINLGHNNIKNVSRRLFEKNTNLGSIRLENNNLTSLPADLFQNFENLENVTLFSCKIKDLPSNMFLNSTRITNVYLQHNMITQIPVSLFRGLKNLETVDLGDNFITSLHADTFRGLVKLKELRLGSNMIVLDVWGDYLRDSRQLMELHVNDNQIESIDAEAFYSNLELNIVNFANNKLKLDEDPFNNNINLEELNLSGNLISIYFDNLTKNQLRRLYLDNNRITNVDFAALRSLSQFHKEISLKNNLITTIDLTYAETTMSLESDLDARSYSPINTVVYLDNNPINCDCTSFNLFRYYNLTMDPRVRAVLELRSNNLYCAQPANLAGTKVEDVKPHMAVCKVEQCPRSCDCYDRSFDKAFIVDCADRRLTQTPLVKKLGTSVRMEVLLQYNNLSSYPARGIGYEEATVLNLSNNMLKNISWIADNMTELYLSNNSLIGLDDDILFNMSRLSSITLNSNPWMCDCKTQNLSQFVFDHNLKYKDDIRCGLSGPELIKADLCPTHTTLYLALSIVATVTLALAALLFAFYYKYDKEIKIWMYSHNVFLYWVTEEDIDKDKEYDAFLSYSHVDESFVVKELVSKLENGPYPYKLCIHVRNWMPGEFISTQVTESVMNSRRTIVVLSPSFLNSVWGKMEFRAAHAQALSEKRTRVIVILYGDIDPNSDLLDDELKSYLKTNTYIKWGDPWFWDRMRYALPHNPRKTEKSKKFENISVKLDKMDLINGNMTPNIMSTPPVNPLLLKGNPLEFKPADSATNCTPPAEAGLDMVIAT